MKNNNGKKVKILHIIHSLQVGGAELVLLNLCSGMVKQYGERFEIIIVCTNEDGDLFLKFKALGIQVISLHLAGSRFYVTLGKLFRLIRSLRPDIVHTHLFPPDRYGQLAAFVMGVRFRFSTIHNMEPQLSWLDKITVFIIKYFTTHIVSVSCSAKNHYIRNYSINPKKISVIYNAPGHEPSVAINSDQLFKQRPVKIVSLDNIKPSKGQRYLIPVVQELLSLGAEVHLDIIGSIVGDYAEEVKNQAAGLSLDKKISFMNYIPDPVTLLHQYHLMLSLSIWEGFHISLVEGMAAGLPIVTTPIEPHRELFGGIENFPFVHQDDPKRTAKVILSILSDQSYFNYLSRENIRRSKDFSNGSMVKGYVALYSSCL